MAKDNEIWPSVDSPERAVTLMRYGAYTAGLTAVLTAGVGAAAIYLGHPVVGMDGWSLADSALFAVVAWRMHRLSLPWAIVGLAMFALERVAGFVIHPSFGTVVGQVVGVFLFGTFYLNAVRGGLYLRNRKPVNEDTRQAAPAEAVPAAAPANEAPRSSEPGLYLLDTEPLNEDTRQAAPAAAPAREAPRSGELGLYLVDTEEDKWQAAHMAAPGGDERAAKAKFVQDEYAEFLLYLRQKDRRFLRPGRTVQEEFAAWRVDHAKRHTGKRELEKVGARG